MISKAEQRYWYIGLAGFVLAGAIVIALSIWVMA